MPVQRIVVSAQKNGITDQWLIDLTAISKRSYIPTHATLFTRSRAFTTADWPVASQDIVLRSCFDCNRDVLGPGESTTTVQSSFDL
jgi:hypothetical protein